MARFTSSPPFQYAWRFVLLGSAYIITVRVGLSLYPMHEFATLIWPPTGIALVALFFWGYEMWPAIVLGAFFANITMGASLPVALGIAVGNTLEALLGAYVLREVVILKPTLERIRDSFGLICTATTVSMIGASIGVASLAWGGAIASGEVLSTWLSWWVGNSLSMLVLTPFLILWLWEPFSPRTRWQVIEAVMAFCLLIFVDSITFFGPFVEQLHGLPMVYVFVPLAWISLRMGPRGITFASILTASFVLLGTVSGHGVFSQGDIFESLFVSQIFIVIVSVVFFIFTSSVEERKEVERALETHVGALEHLVEKVSSEGQAKTDFLAILAHELRNPLAPIVSALELVKINGIMPENAELFDTIEGQIHTMGQLLDDLLDISRITHKKFKLQKETVELQSVLNRSLETVRPFIKDRKHTLVVSVPQEPVWLNGDPLRITQIFVNILYNAAKYTNPGGTITVTGSNGSGVVRIEVADTGIGIEPHMFTKIFEPFMQVNDSSSDAVMGLGIGLALTKRLVELHGGTISVESKGKGKGSTFAVTLPALDIVQLPIAISLSRKRGWEKKTKKTPVAQRILIVDDNEVAAHSLQKLLEHGGHEVGVEHDGMSTLEYVRLHHPEVVILDIGLPDLSGYEVAKHICMEQNPPPLLIALSGYGQKEDKEKAFAAGFDHHLTKPIRVSDIEELLQKPKGSHEHM